MRQRPDSATTAWLWIAAALLSAAPFLLPVYNSDLFWHLSAGRAILESGALPGPGVAALVPPSLPWIDFEWLSQVCFQAAYAAAGFWGLWLLKALALAACAWLLLETLRRKGVPAAFRAGALALWSAGALYFADIRPELFSMILLGALFLRLERWRGSSFRLGAPERLAVFAAFSLWSNLHGGFPLGLLAFACYLAPEIASGRRREAGGLAATAACALAGTVVNPYGTGPYRVLYAHWLRSAELTRNLVEWQPLTFSKEFGLQPIWLLLGLCAAVIGARLAAKDPWRRKLPWGLALSAAALGAGALSHMRLASFFDAPALLLILVAASEAGWLKRRAAKAALAAVLILDAGFMLWFAPHLPRNVPFADDLVPVAAADFLARERPAVEPLRIYNDWQWGGYLAWRLSPWYVPYDDGRYIFHDRLEPARAALSGGPRRWEKFLGDARLNALLVKSDADAFPRLLRPDGTPLGRPWYAVFLPRERWALVYRDDKSLFFVRRDAAPAPWLAAHDLRTVGKD